MRRKKEVCCVRLAYRTPAIEAEKEKERLKEQGYQVVVFAEGEREMIEGMREVARSHAEAAD